MKQILFILVSVLFLQAQANTCLGNTPAVHNYEAVVELDAKQTSSAEEKTEALFYGFITKDVAAQEVNKGKKAPWYYTKFKDANEALENVLALFDSSTDMASFGKTKKYSTKLMEVKWSENTDEASPVKGGFAQIEVTFRNRKDSKYTVIFTDKL